MKRVTVRGFVVITVGLVAVVSMVATGAFSALLYENLLRRQAEQNAEAIAHQTFDSMYQVMRLGWGREELQRFVDALEDAYGRSAIRVWIYRGELVDERYGPMPGDNPPDAAIDEAFANGRVLRQTSATIQRLIMPVAARDECLACHDNADSGDVLGVVEVAQDIGAVRAEALAGFGWLAVATLPLLLLLVGGVGYVVNRRLKGAIERFGGQVERVNAVADIHRLAPAQIDLGFADLNCVMKSVDDLIGRLKAIAVDKEILRTHQDRLEREQETAERIVARALQSPALETAGLRYFYRPAEILAGDLLLVDHRPNGNLLVLIGDFTGHGIGAAVGVPGLAGVFYEMVARGTHPAEMLDTINERLYRGLPPDMFLTAALIEVDYRGRRIGVWNGGMPPVWLIAAGEVVARFSSSDLPLGIAGSSALGRRTLTYQEVSASARLFACSDGVVEVADADGAMFGPERLEATLIEAPPEGAFDTVLQRLEAIWASARPKDDTTLLELDLERLLTTGKRAGYGAAEANRWQAELVLDAATLAHVNPVSSIMDLLSDLGGMDEDRQSLYFVVAELFTNALEHGVLGLSSTIKDDDDGFAAYYAQRAQRLAELEDGEIRIRVVADPRDGQRGVVIEVEDSGSGFDFGSDAAHQALERPRDVGPLAAGRGIAMVKSLCDEVEYFPPGNRVRVRYSGGRRAG